MCGVADAQRGWCRRASRAGRLAAKAKTRTARKRRRGRSSWTRTPRACRGHNAAGKRRRARTRHHTKKRGWKAADMRIRTDQNGTRATRRRRMRTGGGGEIVGQAQPDRRPNANRFDVASGRFHTAQCTQDREWRRTTCTQDALDAADAVQSTRRSARTGCGGRADGQRRRVDAEGRRRSSLGGSERR